MEEQRHVFPMYFGKLRALVQMLEEGVIDEDYFVKEVTKATKETEKEMGWQ